MAQSESTFSGGVFISYRRTLTGGHAGRLHEKLVAEHGRHRVFFDQDDRSIPTGPDFPDKIIQALQRADVILILMAEGWAKNLHERAQHPDADWVLTEAKLALDRLSVSPAPTVHVVCFGGASCPKASELPEAIKGLAGFNAYLITRDDWDNRNEPFQRLMREIRAVMPRDAASFDLPDIWKTICDTVRGTLTSESLVGLTDFDGLLDRWQQRALSQQSACEPGKALVDLKATIFQGRQAGRLSREGLSDVRRVRDVQDACLKLVAAWLRLGACQLANRPGVLGDGRRPAELETLAAHLFALAARDQRQASVRFEPGTAGRRRQIPLTRALDQGTVTSGIGSDRSASILDQLWLMGTGNTLEDRPYSHNPQHARDVRDVASSIRSLNREDGQSRVTIALTGADPAKAGAELLREWLARLKLNVDVIVRTGTTDADHSQDEDDLIYPAWECLVQIEGIGCDAPK